MWQKIKKLIDKAGGKFIIVENEKPAYVVLPIEEYENLLDSSQIAKANQEISQLKASQPEQTEIESAETKDEDEVKVEDLPF